MSELTYNIILCTDINKCISKNGKIPWKFQEDLNFFRDKINAKSNGKQSIIIMGRKTYEEMNVVKNQINIIISSTLKDISLNEEKSDNTTRVYILGSVDLVESFIKNNLCIDNPEIWICGGKQIYDYFLQKPKSQLNILWTEIQDDFECDNHIMFYNTIDFEQSIRLECKNLITNNNHQLIFRQQFNKVNSDKVNSANKPEQAYLDEMYKIITTGSYMKCRNGYTLSKFGSMLKFNLDSYPLLTTKKIQFKTIFEELMFFIRGDTDNKKLREKGVKIWDGNTTKEFIEKCGLPYEEDDLGPMYGFQWRHFNADYKDCKQDYTGQGFDQLNYILTELKSNPTSRRLIFTTYNPAQAFKGVLFPCHGICIQFNVEPVNLECVNLETKKVFKLNISENQRSCDYFLGVPFNIASYALLNYMVCSVLNSDLECRYKFIPGELTMFLGDYHLYEEHLIQAKRQILRTPNKFPKLIIKNHRANIEHFEFEDFVLEGYEPYGFIQAKMIA